MIPFSQLSTRVSGKLNHQSRISKVPLRKKGPAQGQHCLPEFNKLSFFLSDNLQHTDSKLKWTKLKN